MNVVLPAPFGPIRPTSLPSPTSSPTSTTARTPPKLTETPAAWSTLTARRPGRLSTTSAWHWTCDKSGTVHPHPVPGTGDVTRVELFLRGEASSGRFAPELARRAAVGRAEEPAEVLRARQAPATGDREDRLVAERRVEEVAAAVVQARGPDPPAHARALGLEELVQVARRDEARTRDLVGIEVRVAEVRLDEGLRVEQDLRPRAWPRRRLGAGRRGVQATDEVEHAVHRVRHLLRRDRPVLQTRGEAPEERDRRTRKPLGARDPDRGQAADLRLLPPEQVLGHPDDQ